MATCIPGLASVLTQELTELNCQQVTPASTSAVWFQADLPTALRVILWVRTAHKVLELLATSEDIRDKDGLYQWIQTKIPVTEVLQSQQQPSQWLTLSVQVIRNQVTQLPTDLTHSHFTALTIKNALVDQARDLSSDRPSVSLDDPDVPLVAILHGSRGAAQVSLYRQLHTDSLHKRGYRRGDAIHKAALKESLAAGLLLQAGFSSSSSSRNSKQIIVDPMAGSGTLLMEAALMAANIAPGLMNIKCGGSQIPPVVRWHHPHDAMSLWKDLLREATLDAKTSLQRLRDTQSCRFYGNELHPGALQLFRDSLHQAGLSDLVQVQQGNCNAYEIPVSGEAVTVVTNPPWGIRLDSGDEDEAWDDLRTFLRSQLPPGSEAWVLSGNKNSTRQLKWKRTNMFPIQTGQQQLRWIQYKVLSDEERNNAHNGEEDDDGKVNENRPRSAARSFLRDMQSSEHRDRQRTLRNTSSNRNPPQGSERPFNESLRRRSFNHKIGETIPTNGLYKNIL